MAAAAPVEKPNEKRTQLKTFDLLDDRDNEIISVVIQEVNLTTSIACAL